MVRVLTRKMGERLAAACDNSHTVVPYRLEHKEKFKVAIGSQACGGRWGGRGWRACGLHLTHNMARVVTVVNALVPIAVVFIHVAIPIAGSICNCQSARRWCKCGCTAERVRFRDTESLEFKARMQILNRLDRSQLTTDCRVSIRAVIAAVRRVGPRVPNFVLLSRIKHHQVASEKRRRGDKHSILFHLLCFLIDFL